MSRVSLAEVDENPMRDHLLVLQTPAGEIDEHSAAIQVSDRRLRSELKEYEELFDYTRIWRRLSSRSPS
jgi:hypothetical protein